MAIVIQETDQDILEMVKYALTAEGFQVYALYPNLPVIAMSCNCNINEEYNAKGLDDSVPKPFDLDQLYGTLRKYIPKSRP